MKVPPQVETEGLRAYGEVCAFEEMRRKRLPWVYGGLTLLMALAGGLTLAMGHPDIAVIALVTAAVYSLLAGFIWRNRRIQYEKNLRMLAAMESEYGEDLPWLRVERHFAALDRLRAELAKETPAEGGKGGEGR